MIFDVAPADAHAVTAAALKEAHVPRACLLRRVVANHAASPSFQPALAAGGLRGDRLSVWALQVGEAPIKCVKTPGTYFHSAKFASVHTCDSCRASTNIKGSTFSNSATGHSYSLSAFDMLLWPFRGLCCL